MKNIFWYILNKIRYCICLVLIIYIALPLVPLIIFTNFSWIGILYIANEEGCSLSKAKKIYLKNKNGKYTDKASLEANNDNELSEKMYYDAHHNPSCSYMPTNIFHNRGHED